jgi:hypothetical protein
MRRILSTYPAGEAGIALLLLRISLVLLVMECLTRCFVPNRAGLLLTDLAALAILLGYGTRVLAALCALAALVLAFVEGEGTRTLLLSQALEASALAVIGPGALSVDARLCGGRTIVVSDQPSPRSTPARSKEDHQ